MASIFLSKIEELKKKIAELEKALDVSLKKTKLADLQDQSGQGSFWQDTAKAKKIMQEIKYLERQINLWNKLDKETSNLKELAASMSSQEDALEKEVELEFLQLKKAVENLETETYLSGEYDQNNAILSINAGAGGTDAMDWAQILMRMYSRYCDVHSFSVELADISYGEEAGVKSATLIISGPFAYGYLKTEKGIHRLVRMSPFNSDGKRHTSFASVDITPEITEDADIEIEPKDLRVDTYRASGPGGQHVNKTDSAIRITHIPTNFVVQCQSDRSQHKNRETALKILKAKLYERMKQEQKDKIEELKGPRKEIGWGNQIRSYVFAPYTMVKDHRTNTEVANVNRVVDGAIEPFIEAMLKSQGSKKN